MRFSKSLLTALLASTLVACGGNSNNSGDDSDTPRNGSADPGVVEGKVVAPDGQTPLAGATVYVPDPDPAPKTLQRELAAAALSCEPPAVSYLAYACTDASGAFSLSLDTDLSTLSLVIQKGVFSTETEVSLEENGGAIVGDIAMTNNASQIAVVTGAYDSMEDILAKLGYGTLESFSDGETTLYELELGTETFALYDGDGSLEAPYPEVEKLFEIDPSTGAAYLYNYELVFLNCGIDAEYDLLDNPSVRNTLQDYVSNGGNLYVTDLSYDFVEQVFPQYINFMEGNDGAVEFPEEQDAAELGIEDIVVQASVLDTDLLAWLGNVTCVGGNCLNADNRLTIQGFAVGWSVIDEVSTADSTKTWISGEVTYEGGEQPVTKPLTVTFDHGQGRVLYTSYHTEHHNPSAGFWPQERVLQYLVFEL